MGDTSWKASASQSSDQAADISFGDLAKDHTGLEEGEPLSGKDHAHMQAEAHQSDLAGLNGKVIRLGNNQEYEEENMDASKIFQWIVDTSKEPIKVLPLQSSSSISESLKRKECAELDQDLSISLADALHAVSNEDKVEIESASGDGLYFANDILSDIEKTKMVDGLGGEIESTDENTTGSLSPCIVSNSLEGGLSKDISQAPLLSVRDDGQQQSQIATEILLPSTSTGKGEVNVGYQNELDPFLDPSNQEWTDLDFGETILISTDIEGWEHFDPKEAAPAQGANPGVSWQEIVDNGLGNTENNNTENESNLILFTERLERVPSSSEADGLVGSKALQHADRPSQLEESSSLHFKEVSNDEKVQWNPFSGMAPSIEGEKNVVSLDFMEPVGASSLKSLVDPKSRALFEANMPTYQAKQFEHVHECGEEQWVASFDLVPSTEEITRSLSMPRSGSDTAGQSCFMVNREQEPIKKENQLPSAHRSILGLLSPKVSPLVQKVVEKVRSTPAAANGVLNSVQQVTSPKVSDKKSTLRSLSSRCKCW